MIMHCSVIGRQWFIEAITLILDTPICDFCYCELPTSEPKGPEVDLAFAVNVAQQNLKLVKETVQGMIDLYGVGRVHYGFIVFGSSAVIKIPFTDQVTEQTKLKKSVNDALSSTVSSPNLDRALQKAETLFKGSTRSQANKLLVVIMDKLSPSEPVSVKVNDIYLFSFSN